MKVRGELDGGVVRWLEDIGLGRYAELFAEHAIDFDVLADLSEPDLAQLGVTLGDRKRLMRAIARLTRTPRRRPRGRRRRLRRADAHPPARAARPSVAS